MLTAFLEWPEHPESTYNISLFAKISNCHIAYLSCVQHIRFAAIVLSVYFLHISISSERRQKAIFIAISLPTLSTAIVGINIAKSNLVTEKVTVTIIYKYF